MSGHHLPRQTFVITLTAALWSAYFSVEAAHVLLEAGLTGFTCVQIASALLAAALGAGVCLALDAWLRARGGLEARDLLARALFGTALLAVVWRLVSGFVLRPLVTRVAEAADLSIQPPSDFAPMPTASVWWLLMAWVGVWLAVALGDALREAREQMVALETLLRGSSSPSPDIWMPTRRGARRVPVDQVASLEAERDYVRLHLADGSNTLVRSPLKALIQRLGEARFLRVHRSAAVNPAYVTAWSRHGDSLNLTLADQRTIEVGRRRISAVAERLGAESV